MTKEDVESVRNGEDLDKIAVKTALGLITLCTNLRMVRNKPTKKAIDFLQCITNGDYNVNKIIRKKAKLTYVECLSEDESEDGEIGRSRIEMGEMTKSNIEHNIECSVVMPKDFDIDDFVTDFVVSEEDENLFSKIRIDDEEPDMIDDLFSM